MSRTLPTGVATAATAASYRALLAVEILYATPIRLVEEGAGTVTIDGDTYTEGFFAVGDLVLASGEGLQITLPNTGNEVSARDLAEDSFGITVNVFEVHWSAAGAQLTEVKIATGTIASVAWDDAQATIGIVVSPGGKIGMVGRIARRLCGYTFKGTRCGYAGAQTWCDHTHARCTVLANTARFGGFRYCPQIGQVFQYTARNQAPPSARAGLSSAPEGPKSITSSRSLGSLPSNPLRKVIQPTPIKPITTERPLGGL